MDITERVIMSLETYDKIQNQLSDARAMANTFKDEYLQLMSGQTIFKVNELGSTVYIELTKLGAEMVNHLASTYSETHEVSSVKEGSSVFYCRAKPKGDSDA